MTTLSLAEYRTAARQWVKENLQRIEGDDPDMVSDPSEERIVEAKRIQAQLYQAGYAGFTFPVERDVMRRRHAHARPRDRRPELPCHPVQW